jgi:hypothetical protein
MYRLINQLVWMNNLQNRISDFNDTIEGVHLYKKSNKFYLVLLTKNVFFKRKKIKLRVVIFMFLARLVVTE